MRLAFFGSPEFAVPSLERLAARHEVRAVITQPDRPAGRGRAAQPPAVKLAAERLGLPVQQPETVKTAAFRDAYAALQAEAGVVVAYGEILGPKLLALAPRGWWNVHASLLPRWRGAAPIQWAIAAGDTRTGVTIMRMTAGLDAGPTLASAGLDVDAETDADALGVRLAALGAELVAEAMDAVAAGTADARLAPQDEAGVTLAPPLKKEDGRIDWSAAARRVHDRVRGFHSWPGAWTTWRGATLKIVRTRPLATTGTGTSPGGAAPGTLRDTEPGTTPVTTTDTMPGTMPDTMPGTMPGTMIVAPGGEGLRVQCGDGLLDVLVVQRPGKQPLGGADFLRGARLAPGERLGGGTGPTP
ncbi:MAG TPA: methionyl-tRNA formyltransferase [Myxococcota bacterium]|jgi:methionyl-tRNA formyltransferase|nr:methionyl-tRNA formyltransferase [Myxococcota bacterium]